MAIVGRTATVAETTGVQTLTGTLPTDRQAGDLCVVVFACDSSVENFTGPGGSWQVLKAPQVDVNTNLIAAYYQFTPGSAPSGSTTSAAGRWTVICQSYAGVDTSTPVDAAQVTSQGNGTSLAATGVTTATAGAMLLSAYMVDSASRTLTNPAEMTMVKSYTPSVGGQGLALAQETRASAGATGTRTWSLSSTAIDQTAFVTALRPTTAYSRTAADTATPAEGVAGTGERQRAAADTVTLSDEVAATVGHAYFGAIADEVTASDTLAMLSAERIRAVGDTVTPTDSPAAALHTSGAVADTVLIDDIVFVGRGGGNRRVISYYGAVTIGRLVLTESPEVTEKADTSRTLTLAGQEASPPLASQAEAWARAKELLAYRGAVVPVVFTDKPHLTGWYQIGSLTTAETTWGAVTTIRWQCELARVGTDADVEVESRLVGGGRAHASAASAELWHAVPPWSDGYLVGAATPGAVVRLSADGPVHVYRAIPADTNPRWGIAAADYLAAAAEVTVDGSVRTGLTCSDTPGNWALSNGLLRVEPRTSAGTLLVTSFLFSGWGTSKVFDLKRGTTSLGAAKHITILRNDPCECVLRLTWDHAPGRTTCDLALKRGARHVSVYTQQFAAPSPLRVDDAGAASTVTDQLTAAGYIASTSDDQDGNRWVLGSTLACTAAGTFGLAADVVAQGLPAYIGCVYRGASAASGDTAAHINAQYLGAPTETERVIAR